MVSIDARILARNAYVIGLLTGVFLEIIVFLAFNSFCIISIESIAVFIIVTRFLSGLGIFSTLSLVALYILKYLSRYLKGHKKQSKVFFTIINLFLIISFIAILYYSVYSSLKNSPGKITNALGIVMVIVSYYITPIWKEETRVKGSETIIEQAKRFFQNIKLDVLKGYHRYLSKNYLQAYSIEYIKFRIVWDRYRHKASIYLILLIAMSMMMIPLLFTLLVALAVRFFVLKIRELNEVDYMLISASCLIMTALSFIYFSWEIPYLTATWLVPYLLGVLISFLAYLNAMILHGRLFK